MPPPLDLPQAASATDGGIADPQLIRAIFGEIALPPMKPPRDPEKAGRADDEPAKLAAIVPFRAGAMTGYEADYASLRDVLDKAKDFPIRVAVIHAVDALDKLAKSGKGSLMDEFRGQATDDVKKSITESQKEGPARLVLELQEALDELEKVANRRSDEKSKRWLAHYDYVTAQVKARMAYVQEYNLMLGKAKRDQCRPRPEVAQWVRWHRKTKSRAPRRSRISRASRRSCSTRLSGKTREHPGKSWRSATGSSRSASLGSRRTSESDSRIPFGRRSASLFARLRRVDRPGETDYANNLNGRHIEVEPYEVESSRMGSQSSASPLGLARAPADATVPNSASLDSLTTVSREIAGCLSKTTPDWPRIRMRQRAYAPPMSKTVPIMSTMIQITRLPAGGDRGVVSETRRRRHAPRQSHKHLEAACSPLLNRLANGFVPCRGPVGSGGGLVGWGRAVWPDRKVLGTL